MKESTVTAFLETLLWSESYYRPEDAQADGESYEVTDDRVSFSGEIDDGTPLGQIVDVSDLDTLNPKISKEAREDLEGFASYCEETLGFDPFLEFDADQVAHDFCLSRNGHGAGFFDRGCYRLATEEAPDQVMIDATRDGRSHCKPVSDGGQIDVHYALQDAANTFGTFGLMLWVKEDGTLGMESHS